MRYNVPIFFQRIEKGELDPNTHNYCENTVFEDKRFAGVTLSGDNTLKLVYGGIKQRSLTVRLLRPYTKPFDRIKIGENFYRVDFSRGNKTFVVSEVQ